MSQFIYLLNAFEAASQDDAPADVGYAEKRKAVLEYVAKLESARPEVARITEWLRENAPDCGDNSCLFGGRGKGGMRTNGGCRCFKDVRPDMKRIFIERMWTALCVPSPQLPKEPTHAMLEAARMLDSFPDDANDAGRVAMLHEHARKIWQAMLAAANRG